MKVAKELMQENRIRHLPVIDTDQRIISMLSKHNLTDIQHFSDMPVDFFSTHPVQYVTEKTPLSTVALLMLEKKISSVLLCDDNKNVLGIITTDDLLYSFSQLLKEKEKSKLSNKQSIDFLASAGEFFRKLSDIGI
jgi:CBS domain-containing protein